MFKVNPEVVRAALFKSGGNLRDFAKSLELNELTLKKILFGDAKVSGKIVAKLAQALNVEGNQLLAIKEE